MSSIRLHDQVCYRTVMQLCGEYGRPYMGKELLDRMQCMGLEPNALTYGIYHRAIMQGDWPSLARLNAIEAWKRLQLRMEGCVKFRARLKNINFIPDVAYSAAHNSVAIENNSTMDSPQRSLNASNASLESALSSQEQENISINAQEQHEKKVQ